MTAARNEQAFIEKVIRSVISQTILPVKWIIVNDGSKDRTQEIVTKYLKDNAFIELISVSGDKARNFGSKARALEYAYKKLRKINFDYVGNLDADIAFDKDYYERLLEKFNTNSKLGVAGGKRYDKHSNKFKLVRSAHNSVGGPFQFFARKCYEDIGGYMPLRHGGIDSVAEIKARKMGWQVKSFKDLKVFHFRRTGRAKTGGIRSSFNTGVRDYHIGYHPFFQIFKVMKKSLNSPYILGSIAAMCGYCYAYFAKQQRQVSKDFVKYLRKENMRRFKLAFHKFFPFFLYFSDLI